MSETKHAPAPWREEDDDSSYICIVDANGKTVIGGCGCCGSPFGGDHLAADKALIIASPDLLSAAKALIGDVKSRYPGEDLRCQFMIALDAACTKATTILDGAA